jgi:hypothetical protein
MGNPYIRFKRLKKEAILQNVARACLAPSMIRIFRKGAKELLHQFLLKAGRDRHLIAAKSQLAFDRALGVWIRKFPRKIRRSKGKVTYGHKAKVLDVFLKELVERRHGLPAAQARNIEQWLHVPIDSLVHEYFWDRNKGFCRVVKKECEALTERNTRLAVLEKNEYKCLQEFLRKQARAAHTEPIWLDYWAWSVRKEDRGRHRVMD